MGDWFYKALQWLSVVVIIGSLIYITTVLCGCHAHVQVDKRPNIAYPIYDCANSNVLDWVIVDQGYEIKYAKWGFNTDIESMTAEITTNKTVNFTLGGLHSNASITNCLQLSTSDILNLVNTFREANIITTKKVRE